MAIATNVVRRGATYYVRAAVPVDLQPRIGRKERWESLRTKEWQEAKRRARAVLSGWDSEYDDLRRRTGLPEADLQAAVWDRYQELLQADENFRQSLPTDADLDSVWRELEREFGEYDLEAYRVFEYVRDQFEHDHVERASKLAALRANSARGETRLVADLAQREIHRRKLDVQVGSPEYRKLAQGLQRAELEALVRAAERDQGNWGGEPRDALVKPPVTPPPPVAAPGETIMELFEQYARENPRNVRADTINQNRMAVELFAGFVELHRPAASINRKAVREWKLLLMQYPVKAAEIGSFRHSSLREIVKLNEKLGKPAISDRTVNRYLSGLGAFCAWLVANEYLAQNPLGDIYKRIDKTKRKTVPFSVEQLNALFGSPLFRGCQSAEKLHLPGNLRVDDHRYWLPLIMLFSGARPGEIAQLLTADVRQSSGVWCIHISEEGDPTKRVKTKGSQRVVPVHATLERLGFIAFCNRQALAGERRLFPSAERNRRGQIAAKFSRDFGRYLQRIGLKCGRGLSLYSFRHGFVDALRRAGFLDDQFGYIIGHAKPSTTEQYGQIPQGMLQQRVDLISSVDYPGLKIEHLFPPDTLARSTEVA